MTKQNFCGRLGCGYGEGEAGFPTNITLATLRSWDIARKLVLLSPIGGTLPEPFTTRNCLTAGNTDGIVLRVIPGNE